MRWYVYLLVDSRDGRPFYVGKGTGRRAWKHAPEGRGSRVTNDHKAARLKDMRSAAAELIVQIVARFDDEDDAYAFERAMIETLPALTNISPGSQRPRKAEEMAIESYDAMLAAFIGFDAWRAFLLPGLPGQDEGLWLRTLTAIVQGRNRCRRRLRGEAEGGGLAADQDDADLKARLAGDFKFPVAVQAAAVLALRQRRRA